jgi:transcriptional regulator with XRE-family HTH domain
MREFPASHSMNSNAILQDLGATIREHRQALGLSQQDVADLAGVGLSALTRIESGTGNPTVRVIASIGHTLGLRLTLASIVPTLPLVEPGLDRKEPGAQP